MRLLAIGTACLALTACATTPNVRVDEAKGLAASWAALDAVAVTLDGLATSHVLKGQQATMAATDLQKASDALTAATAASKAGDNATAAQNVAVASALVATLVQIASQNGGT